MHLDGRKLGVAERFGDGDGRVVTRWMGVRVERSHDPENPARADGRPEEDAESVLTFAASTETEDRSGDVVIASGWELDAFRRNPVFLWAHRHDQPPIGRVIDTWVEGTSLMATVRFAPTQFAQEVAGLYRHGYLSGVSVGFRALEIERRKASDGRPATLFMRQELLEISAAPVPLNSEALMLPNAEPDASSVEDCDKLSDDRQEEPDGEEEAIKTFDAGRLWRQLAQLRW